MSLATKALLPRVLQVVLRLSPGGTERLVVELVKRSAGIPMAVCCLDERGAWGDELHREGIVVETLGRRPGFHPLLARLVAKAAARHQANVIHAHQYSPFVYSALSRLWRPRSRVILTEHGRLSDAPPSSKRRFANRFLSALPSEVYAVSSELGDHIVGEGFPRSMVNVIYNGIDIGPLPVPAERHAARRALGLSEDTFVVATIARLDPVKDLGVLIAAVAEVNRHRPAVLLVIGDGPERSALEAVSRAADGGKATRFLGHRDDARSVLAGCDAFANSSISEGVSLTILEAMAAGLPIVATRVGGTPEVVDESCALLVPARDSGALANALMAVANDSPRGRALGAAARARVEARFTLDRMVREYNDAYRRVAAA